MKKFTITIVLLLGIFESTYPHEQHVHQYIVREAYQLLRMQLGFDVPVMQGYVATSEQGTGPYIPGGSMVIGAYREDEEDPVWGYGSVHIPGTASMTHLWDLDNGDGANFNFLGITYPNAYAKSLKYLYGGYELQVYYPGTGITEAYDAPSYLPNYYKTGTIFYRGFYNIAGQFTARNYWTTSSQGFRDRVVWEILGRVAHLLADLGVPAHAHFDPHPAQLGDPDSYETAMGNQYVSWNHTHAFSQGGFMNVMEFSNPIKYLFYTTAQIADHFPSDDVGGDNTFGINEPFSNYPPLQDIINNLGPPPPSINVSQIANTAFVYSIRATAGLLYWFAMETDLLANTLVQNSFGGGRIRVNGADRSSGYRTPAWRNPPPVTLQAIDQLYNGCFYVFNRWRKLVNGSEAQG